MATEEGMRLLREIHAMLTKLTTGGGKHVADDSDLDGQWGDEEIRKSPPRWKGEDFAGRHMSQTTPEFLECFAEFNDWKAERDDEKAATLTDAEEAAKKRKYAGYARKSAARARGWAARLRSGWKPPAAPETDGSEEWS